jgi:predicted lactoylglutathione lyase
MSKMVFVTVPVHDLAASTALHLALGGEVNARLSDGQATSIMFSDAIGVMLMTPDRYRDVTRRPAGDAERGRHALLTLRADDSNAMDVVRHQDALVNHGIGGADGYVWEIVWMDAAPAGTLVTA